MRGKLIISLVTAGAWVASSPAFAQYYYVPAHGHYRDRPDYAAQAPRVVQRCIPMCPFDRNPCDPIYFKRGDGRCTERW